MSKQYFKMKDAKIEYRYFLQYLQQHMPIHNINKKGAD